MSTPSLTVAYLTLENRDGFHIYDHLTEPPLAELGWGVTEIPWDRAGVDWSEFDAVVIRSTWDYQNSPEDFLRVLEDIEDSQTPLFNPLKVCRWNLHKSYLRDLEAKGIPIVPTQWLNCLDQISLEKGFSQFRTDKLVAKPTVGANADDTFVLSLNKRESWRPALALFESKPLMLQPFVEAIVQEGEFSLFYFGGQFSHAIAKKPAKGDFRVQEEHGGSIRALNPDESLKDIADKVLQTLEEELLYARIDIVRLKDGGPVLTELELIEPSLYFQNDLASPRRFAETLDRFVSRLRSTNSEP